MATDAPRVPPGERAGNNLDPGTVEGFGREWSKFRQQDDELTPDQREQLFAGYFAIFPWERLGKDAIGIDVGCGSGRWAVMVAPRVGHLHVLDASAEALAVARSNLAGAPNVSFHHGSVERIPLLDGALDFAISLGVLHHVPDTAQAIRDVVRKLKPGAPFLVYLYYAFDNRPAWYRAIWRASEAIRLVVSRLPYRLRLAVTQTIALLVYWPLARAARALDACGLLPNSWPLAFYRNKSFYVMRTDSFDRFGTQLEQRFTRAQIEVMLRSAGLSQIRFSELEPYWCAVGFRDESVRPGD